MLSKKKRAKKALIFTVRLLKKQPDTKRLNQPKPQECIIALSGSFDVILDDGKEKKTFSLNRSYYGLYIPNRTWRELNNFSTNSLALILSSTKYDESDYIRNYDNFLKEVEHE